MIRSIAILGCLLCISVTFTGCEAVNALGQTIKSFDWANDERAEENQEKHNAQLQQKNLMANLPDQCPQLKILGDLSRITQFSVPKKPKAEDMIASAQFSGIDATCQIAANSVTLDISLDFDGALGAVGSQNGASEANYTYPYFLSVINPKGQILSKDVFALSMVYSGGESALHKQDKLRQTIPLMLGQDPRDFQIVIGFQLSEEELEYNRTQK